MAIACLFFVLIAGLFKSSLTSYFYLLRDLLIFFVPSIVGVAVFVGVLWFFHLYEVTLGKGKGTLITGLRRNLGFQEFEASRIYRQSAHENGHIYLLETSLVLVYVTD